MKYRARSPVIALRFKRARFAVFLLTEPGIYRTRPLHLTEQEKEKHQVLEESSKLEHADADRTEGASSLQRRSRKTRPTPRSAGRKTTQHKRSPCEIIPHCQS